ncbi:MULTISPECIES: tripartite tricarboxylate transporter substrate binding protein [Pseudomonas]|uniref:Putative tricarboxylic transport membrane protein n=1 Tax=Ectopseudomonas oleovorans TaxID=301 RepID=A0A653B8W7_ECTOL|nr:MULTISPECIES: tripartite tricarboxylate transporter substrate binding protein [Pseudomonas]QTS88004.1 tripartite tricarboxylate transporter substrate binding protein [Pseudomonas khazarica]WFC61780.1 tripartite tricarboxylate transporter substrate binding protein [Pseudomonas sp. REST10]CAE6907992.1 Putative tricarboxylic transport membrane protein [Pseudomonas oleovorans]|tara:strand:+ start:885 stop:1862 length:978 start_codon:yes stop_codon:yes gene_type:complete
MKSALTRAALAVSCLAFAGQLLAAEPKRPECIAPAKPGGGFDLTCKLAQSGLKDTGLLKAPMRVTYMPGGVGAVAYNAVVAQRAKDPGTITAFSSGSLLNLAQGKFGRYDEHAVRWLAAIGTDYGAITVRADAPWQTLGELVEALKKDPASVVFGAGATIGGQDWMQTALIARAAGIDPQSLRYVAFEGGGETLTAMLGGHVQVTSSGLGEVTPQLAAGKVRILAVLSDERLPGKLADIPTAKEQGYDISWPVIRGFYMGPQVSDEQFAWWQGQFEKMLARDDFAALREQRDLFPLSLTGDELNAFVLKQVQDYKALAGEFGLVQ